jgi:hypothetical protein
MSAIGRYDMDDAISRDFLAHAEAQAEQAFLEPGFFPHSHIEILEAPLVSLRRLPKKSRSLVREGG